MGEVIQEEPQGKLGNAMNSPCLRQASKTCLHGCCAAPFLALHQTPKMSSKTNNSVTIFRYEFTLATAASLCCYPNTQFTNHESLPSLHEAYAYFTRAYPEYSQTDQADFIRAHEYYHLTLSNHVCLDYIGHGLFSFSQLQQHHQTPPLASPSSSSSPPTTTIPQSLNSPEPFCFDISYKSVNLHTQLLYGGHESEFETDMKKRIMAYMNISEVDYTLVFTANQSSAFKLLADSYPFHKNPSLLSVYDYKNEAVDVMAESCKKRRGSSVMSAKFSWPNMRIQTRKLKSKIRNRKKMRKQPGLFVFPLQSRVTGARYSYQWMSIAQENGWHVLLDACALGPKDMDTLGLSFFKPDFIICSFFKVFGENPSGFGCLFVKKSSASVLKKSSLASSIGIVSLVPSSVPSQILQEKSSDKLVSIVEKKSQTTCSEIVELERDQSESDYDQSENWESYESSNSSRIECRGLDHADELGLVLISRRARYLSNWLVNALMSLQHPHYSEYGHQLVKIYGPKIKLDRGPSLSFNVFDWKGEKIEPSIVQKLADRHNISLSYGILDQIRFSDKQEQEKETKSETCRSEVEGAHVSVVTAALGFLTSFEDIYRLWAFVSRFLDADFVEKERWRYMALNQRTVEV